MELRPLGRLIATSFVPTLSSAHPHAVILSGARTSRSEVRAESKDPYTLPEFLQPDGDPSPPDVTSTPRLEPSDLPLIRRAISRDHSDIGLLELTSQNRAENGFGAASRAVLVDGHTCEPPHSEIIVASVEWKSMMRDPDVL